MTRCESCGAPILFAKTEAGRSMPMDAEPVEANPEEDVVRMIFREDGVLKVRRWQRSLFDEDPAMYESHWGTCPQSKAWSNGELQRKG